MQQRALTIARRTGLLRGRMSPLAILAGIGTFARRKPLGFASALIVISMLVIAIFSPLIVPFEPEKPFVGQVFASPTLNHWFGTDDLGRDTFSRTLAGSRISLYVGFLSVLLSTVVGSFLGLVSGYLGGRTDIVVQRVVDAIMAFPPLILALAIIAVRGPSTNNSLLVISVVFVPASARVVRGAVLSVKENVYIEAARALGAGPLRIMLRHVLPNVTAPIIVIASVLLGAAVLVEASLAFLGAGTQPPTPSWGGMIRGEGTLNVVSFQAYPWLAIAPAAAISLAVFAFNLLGDAIRDMLDPRLRGAGSRIK